MALAFGALAASSLSSLASHNSAKQQFKNQSALQAQAAKLNYQYAEKTARNSPIWNRAGLESAGYNPMLAVQNSTSGANSSWTNSGNATSPDYAGAISQGVANAQSFQRLNNETNQSESISDANYAAADKAKAEKAEISARLPFIPKQQRALIAKLESDAQLAEAQKHNLKERLELDRYINDSGLATTRRGQDLMYNASTYATNTQAETQRGIRTDKLPFGFASTYYDMRGLDPRMRTKDAYDSKYWRNYY